MDPTNAGTSADAPRSSSGDGGAAAVGPEAASTLDPLDAVGRRRGRWLLATVLVPLVLVVVLVIAWAVDTSSGGVARNVHLAGTDVSHLSETQLAAKVAALASAYAAVPVHIEVRATSPGAPTVTYTTTAGEIGLMIDQDRTVAQALAVGDESFFVLRPVSWVGSFVVERDAPVEFQVSADQVATALTVLEAKEGSPTAAADPASIAAALPAAAQRRGTGPGPVLVEVRGA